MKHPVDDILKFRRLLEDLNVNEQDSEPAQTKAQRTKVETELVKLIDMLPKIPISEEWGKQKTPDRKEFNLYFSSLIKGKDPIERIQNLINSLKSFEATQENSGYTNTFQKIVFLNTLYRIINSFSASGAGFIFEGLLSAIMGGKQITDREEGVLTITDVIAAGRSFSAKLLTKGKQTVGIEGSESNLRQGVAKYGTVTYIIVERLESSSVLKFTMFDVNASNLETFLKYTQASAKAKGKFKVSYSYIIANEQFNYKEIGELSISKEHIIKSVQTHLADISNQLKPLYSELNIFTKNLYLYFSSMEEKRRSTVAQATRKSAENLDNKTQAKIK